jgi:hypothetical protein
VSTSWSSRNSRIKLRTRRSRSLAYKAAGSG